LIYLIFQRYECFDPRIDLESGAMKFLQKFLPYSAATGCKVLGELTLDEDSAERSSLELVAP
jgi:hypothetical protein